MLSLVTKWLGGKFLSKRRKSEKKKLNEEANARKERKGEKKTMFAVGQPNA